MTRFELEPVLRLIARCPSGRSLLEQFLPALTRGAVEVRAADPAHLAKLATREDVRGTPAGGFTCTDEQAIIWHDATAPVILQAPLLFHEMIHSLDWQYRQTARREAELFAHARALAQAQVARPARELGPDDLAAVQAKWREAQRFQQARLFSTERRAHHLSYVWTVEARERITGFAEALARLREQGHVLDRQVSDDELIRAYRLELLPKAA